MSLSVKTKSNTLAVSQKDLNYLLTVANTDYLLNVTNLGTPQPANNSVSALAWKTAVLPTDRVPNQWYAMIAATTPYIGTAMVLSKIYVEVTEPCEIIVSKRSYLEPGGSPAPVNNLFREYTQMVTQPGTVIFDFSDDPLIIRYGDTVRLFYAVTGTTGINFQVKLPGKLVAADFNFNAPLECGFMGDSFNVVGEVNAVEYAIAEDDTTTGQWTIITQEYLRKRGIDTLRTNIGVGGTDARYWLMQTRNGLFRRWRPDIVFCNLMINTGMADLQSGSAKRAYKEIIKHYFLNMPNGCFVMLNVEDSDIATRNAIVPDGSGFPSGITLLEALRIVVSEIHSELTSSHASWDLLLAPTTPDNTYTKTQTENFIETVAGTRIHPNTTLGQPKIAQVVIDTVDESKFMVKYGNNE